MVSENINMRIVRNSSRVSSCGIALTIGSFDGIHLGHQKMINRLKKKAGELKIPAGVLIFEPQPQEFFNPPKALPRLTNFQEKVTLLREVGIQQVHILRFDKKLAKMDATAFIFEKLGKQLLTKWLLVGDDFKFGADRTGDHKLLREHANRVGFSLETEDSFIRDGVRVSSTHIRRQLSLGDLDGAKKLLGRSYSIMGRVISGDGFGRNIGYPTANVALRRINSPLSGIFVVEVIGIRRKPLPAVASLGVRPTVTDVGGQVLEVYIFDFNEDIYGKKISVRFLSKLREEEKFSNIQLMVRQMDEDTRRAKEYFSNSKKI